MLNYRASHWTAWRIHVLFSSVYALLMLRIGISIYEGEPNILNLPQNTSLVLAIKKLSGLFYSPFSMPDYEFSLVLMILVLALLHCGMFLPVFAAPENKMSNKISFSEQVLNFCRAAFYVVGLILLLMVILRMGVMLYQDLTFGRPEILISKPAFSSAK